MKEYGVQDPGMVGKFKKYHRGLCLTSFILSLLCLILHIIAFSSAEWIVSDGDSPFQNLGFHKVCFDNCYFPYCPGDPDIIFDGCYTWAFNELIFSDDKFREIVEWLMPSWFMACKYLFIADIVLIFTCVLLLLICSCWAFKPFYTPNNPRQKDVCAITLGFTTIAFLTLSTMITVAGVAIFSSVSPDPSYMPMTYKNHFGYPFWIEFCVCILLGLCIFLTYLSTITKVVHYVGPKDVRYADDMIASGQL